MRIILFGLFVFMMLFASFASAADSVDIRSTIIFDDTPVDYSYRGEQLDSWTISPMNWGGFYYKVNNNESTEKMYVFPYNNSLPMTFDDSSLPSKQPDKVDIYYETKPVTLKYSYKGWNYGTVNDQAQYGVYSIIGFFGETYVTLSPENYILNPAESTPVYKHAPLADKLAKLVINDDKKYLLKTNQELPLGNGYTLVPEQIDVNGNKARLNLLKDGKLIDSSIVSTTKSTSGGHSDTMVSKKDALNETDIQYFRCRASQVFQGTNDSIVEIEGLWLIDLDTAFIVESDAEYEKFKNDGSSSDILKFKAENIEFVKDKSISLGRNISFKTLKVNAPEWGFFITKTESAPKKYEIRSHILTLDNYRQGVQAFNFAGFYLNDDAQGSENFSILTNDLSNAQRTISKGELTYTVTPLSTDYGGKLKGNYYVMGLFGKTYVAFSDKNTNKMMELVMDSGKKRTLSVGEVFDIGNGYTLVPNQIDVNGNKAYMEILKDGKSIGSSVVPTNKTAEEKTWTLNMTLLGEETTIAKVYVDSVFQGTKDSLVEVRGIWLADYSTAREIKVDDDFQKLEYAGQKNAGGVNQLLFKSNDDIILEKGTTIALAENMSVKVADNKSAVRFYLFNTKTIGNETNKTDASPETPAPGTDTPNSNASNSTPSGSSGNQSGTSNDSASKNAGSSMKFIAIGAVSIVLILAVAGFIFWRKNKM